MTEVITFLWCLLQEKDDAVLSLQAEQDKMAEAEEQIEQLMKQKFEFDEKMKELMERLEDEEGL